MSVFTAEVCITLDNVCANKGYNVTHTPAQAGLTGLEMLRNERFQAQTLNRKEQWLFLDAKAWFCLGTNAEYVAHNHHLLEIVHKLAEK